MLAREIISELARRGVAVRAEGDRIIARPLSAVPPELREAARAQKAELLALLARLPAASSPAYSILETCQRYGVALHLDPDGTLVVGKAGAKPDEPTQPWPELLAQIEAHLEAVARLVEAGWTLKAGFPNQAAA